MNNDLVTKIADLVNELKVICDKEQSISIRINNSFTAVFVSDEEFFFQSFDNFKTEKYECVDPESNFTHEATAEVDGIQFSTLLTQSEYEKYVEKEV